MNQDWLYLERFFFDSFPDGQVRRELRLSFEEQQYLHQKYPHVIWHCQGDPGCGKVWYQVILPVAAEQTSL